MIYAIRAFGTNLIKFGKANNPKQRIASLQTGCPVDLALIATADWPDSEERKIHIYLDIDHSRGEWFRDGDRASRLLECMRDSKTGFERWHKLKRKNGVLARLDPFVPLEPKPNHRLGRVLRYAEELARDNTNSATNPAGAAPALQSH